MTTGRAVIATCELGQKQTNQQTWRISRGNREKVITVDMLDQRISTSVQRNSTFALHTQKLSRNRDHDHNQADPLWTAVSCISFAALGRNGYKWYGFNDGSVRPKTAADYYSVLSTI